MSRLYRTHLNQEFIIGTLPVTGTNVNSGSGSWIVPTGVYQITFRVHGGGGAGSGRNTSGTGGMAGGAGGAVAISILAVKPGQTIFYSVATNRTGTRGIPASDGFDSWVRIGVDAPPTTITQGVLAAGGQSAQSLTSPGTNFAQSFDCIGTTIYIGGNGRLGGTTAGGGGSGAGTAANGNNATGRIGASAPTGGGNGGSGSGTGGGNGGAGSQPGGGGGGAFKNGTQSRIGGAGAAGRITIIY
jgi:hypothetical protein